MIIYSLFSLKKKPTTKQQGRIKDLWTGDKNALSGNDLNKIRPYFFKTTHEDAENGLSEPRESPLDPPLKWNFVDYPL